MPAAMSINSLIFYLFTFETPSARTAFIVWGGGAAAWLVAMAVFRLPFFPKHFNIICSISFFLLLINLPTIYIYRPTNQTNPVSLILTVLLELELLFDTAHITVYIAISGVCTASYVRSIYILCTCLLAIIYYIISVSI